MSIFETVATVAIVLTVIGLYALGGYVLQGAKAATRIANALEDLVDVIDPPPPTSGPMTLADAERALERFAGRRGR
jgi:hypothetical protein